MPYALARPSLKLFNTLCACPRKNHAERCEYLRPCCLSSLSKILDPKISFLIGVHFGVSLHSIAGSSFASDFSFHRFELTNESCTATDSAAEDRPLGLNMSEPEEEQFSARSDTASSKRHSKKRPREVSGKKSVSEAGGMKHDVIPNEKAHRSCQVG